jgi:hypothetical protein
MYGVKPVELFHAGNDPAGHSDHVHVAYAYGRGNPAFFTNQKDAVNFENKLTPPSVKSITSNTGELAGLFSGSPTTITNNISIQQLPGQSADELASLVAIKIQNAVAEARASSYYV